MPSVRSCQGEPDAPDDPIRRAAGAAAARRIAACGGDDETRQRAAPVEQAGAFPVTVEHKYGTTEVEEEPERVVTVGYTDQDATLALGVVPVGVGDFLGGYEWRERPWAQEALGGAEPKVVGGQEINFEAVAAQRPDLIFAINAGLKKADYEQALADRADRRAVGRLHRLRHAVGGADACSSAARSGARSAAARSSPT